MDDNFFHTSRGRRAAAPVYDKDGWAPHPEKPGWSINKSGQLRSPNMSVGVPAPKEAYKEPPYPFPST